MRKEDESARSFRRFLLGEADEAEQRRVEETFMTDPEYREKLLLAEHDLIEDYLDDALSPAERERFRAHFLATPQQRRKVRIARSLKSYAPVEFASHSPPAEGQSTRNVSPLRRLANALSLRSPFVYVPLAGALVAAVLFGSWRLIEFRREQQLRAREESQRLEAEWELAQLNDPSRVGPPLPGATVISTALPPVSTRGSANRLPPLAGAGVVELRLLPSGEEYPSYSASLQRVGAASRYAIPNLRAADTPDGRAVPVRIPARLIAPGQYRLTLRGIAADGRTEDADEYTFQRDE